MTGPRGKQPIPGDADLMFIETVAAGTVHIAVRYYQHHMARQPLAEPPATNGAAFVALAMHPTVTRCGKRTFPQFERDHLKTGRFDDDQLCGACYRTLTEADQERAFEHDRPEDEDA